MDLRFKTQALASMGPNGGVLYSNLSQEAAVGREATFNNAFKSVTGNSLSTLAVQSTAAGTMIGFDGEGLHHDEMAEIVLHFEGTIEEAISKQSTFIAGIRAITGGYPTSQVSIQPEEAAAPDPEAAG